MRPTVAIIEPYRDMALPLEEVVMLARCTPVTMSCADGLKELAEPPSAIVVRIATGLPAAAPSTQLKEMCRSSETKVLALTATDEDAAEARRLGCDTLLREPRQVRALYEALTKVAPGD